MRVHIILCVFLGGDEYDEKIKTKLPSEESVLKILNEEYDNFKASSSSSRQQGLKETGSPISSQESQSGKKKRKFQLLDKLASVSPSSSNEIEQYFQMERLNDCEDPLKFWDLYKKNFPVLSKIAHIYLGIPASSGSVERLFSVAGAIARPRRASIKTKMLEVLLCYRQQLINLYKSM